jgi:hypothetical protein
MKLRNNNYHLNVIIIDYFNELDTVCLQYALRQIKNEVLTFVYAISKHENCFNSIEVRDGNNLLKLSINYSSVRINKPVNYE